MRIWIYYTIQDWPRHVLQSDIPKHMVDAMNHFSFHQVHIFCNLFSLHLFLFSFPFQTLPILILPRSGFYVWKILVYRRRYSKIYNNKSLHDNLLKCFFILLWTVVHHLQGFSNQKGSCVLTTLDSTMKTHIWDNLSFWAAY